MHAVEAVRRPAALDLVQGAADQVAGVGGDDAHVVAVGLQVEDVGALDQARAAAGRVDRERRPCVSSAGLSSIRPSASATRARDTGFIR